MLFLLPPCLRLGLAAFLLINVTPDAASQGQPSVKWGFQREVKNGAVSLSADGQVNLNIWIAFPASEARRRFRLVWAELPASRYHARVQAINKSGPQRELLERSNCNGDLAMTGGFFDIFDDEQKRAHGWVVADSREISPFVDFKSGGAFVVSGGAPKILRINELAGTPIPEQALQTKPILIYEGKFDGADKVSERWSRSVIGITRQGNIFVALLHGEANQKISLAETGLALLAFASTSNVELWSILALDGGISGHFYARRLSRHFGTEGNTFLPNIICFQPR